MSKKNKNNIVISDEELKPTVLYTIKEKKGNILVFIFVFAIFIGAVYYLPEAYEKYDQYKKGKVSNPIINNNQNNTTNENPDGNEESEADTRYEYSDTLVIENDEMRIDNFNFVDNTLSFSITNNQSNIVDLTDKNYFLEVYNEGRMAERIKIAEDSFAAGETKSYSFAINTSMVSYFYLKNIAKTNYPDFTLNPDSNGMTSLTCRMNNDTIVYNFLNNNLNSINETVNLNTTDLDYQNALATYQSNIFTYNSYQGVTTSLVESATGYTYNVNINVTSAPMNNFNNHNYYPSSTQANVIKFEMEARGFTCN